MKYVRLLLRGNGRRECAEVESIRISSRTGGIELAIIGSGVIGDRPGQVDQGHAPVSDQSKSAAYTPILLGPEYVGLLVF